MHEEEGHVHSLLCEFEDQIVEIISCCIRLSSNYQFD